RVSPGARLYAYRPYAPPSLHGLIFFELNSNMNWIVYFEYWYPLPDNLPKEIKQEIYEYMFNPKTDPW
uniref:hypothetical protein n=1 Tax=Polynucleobacter sp. TaxID=2029855 RepID=UPI0040480532